MGWNATKVVAVLQDRVVRYGLLLGSKSKKEDGGVDFSCAIVASNDPQAEVPDHALWTQATVELLRRVVQAHERELVELRAQLGAAERRLLSGRN